MWSVRTLIAVIVSLVSIASGQLAPPRDDLSSPSLHPEILEKSEALCKELAKEPFFEPEMVVGPLWKVVYIWNMDIGSRCIELRFKIATPMIIRRFYYDMHEYIEAQPAWGAASLLMKMGLTLREILLFDDQGPAGKFLAVPNVLRDGSQPYHPPMRHAVPLMKFQMKLTKDGKYLIFMDCSVGLASIAARDDQPLNRAEVEAVATSLGPAFGQGFHACVPSKDDFKS